MAKLYVFDVPPINEKRMYNKPVVKDGNIASETVTEPLRNLDKHIYTTLFVLAAAQKKNIADALQCQDCIDQIKNLDDKENVLKFTDADIKFLKEGFEIMAGVDENGHPRRPPVWMEKRRGLFEQIETPLSEEKWLTLHEKKKR